MEAPLGFKPGMEIAQASWRNAMRQNLCVYRTFEDSRRSSV
jgi:hypothetical protein